MAQQIVTPVLLKRISQGTPDQVEHLLLHVMMGVESTWEQPADSTPALPAGAEQLEGETALQAGIGTPPSWRLRCAPLTNASIRSSFS